MMNLLGEHDLDNVDCKKCGNTGNIVWAEDGVIFSKECECMAKRRFIRRTRNSGMEKMLERYTFENYETVDGFRALIKQRAIEFVNDTNGWLYIYGQSGSGKTHICTAVCKGFIEKGVDVYYMNWRDESVILKADTRNSELYNEKMEKLKSVSVLYIDDFLKGGSTAADIKLSFELLNARYNSQKRTVISSEITLEELFETDEAIAGRIYEMSARPRYLIKAPKENYRIRMMNEAKNKGTKSERNEDSK